MWLTDDKKILNYKCNDNYYLLRLSKHIFKCLIYAPVHCISNYIENTNSIEFRIGNNSKTILVDNNVAYHDFITILKNWMVSYYPSWSTIETIKRSLDQDEIITYKKDNPDVSVKELLDLTLNEEVQTTSTIEKIYLKKDEFIVRIDGKKYLYLSKIPLSNFLSNLRNLPNDKKNDYFTYNTRLIKEINNESESIDIIITIDYSGLMMLNFFNININYLRKFKPKFLKSGEVEIGKYRIRFDSLSVKHDCLQLLNN